MSVVDDLRNGRLKPEDLNTNLFEGTKNKLLSGAAKGAKVNFAKIDYATQDYNFLTEVRKNIYAFGGAKTYQHLRSINDLLLDEKGRVIPFREFESKVGEYRAKVMGLEDKYNRQWLEAEYHTCIAQAQNAVLWKQFMQNMDIFPNLRYVTVGDEMVRHHHAILDGLIRPKTDPIWLKIAPVKEWFCRCHLEETDDDVIGELPKDFKPNPVFDGNLAQDGSLFPDKHPYFHENGIDKKRILEKTEGFWAEERKSINRKIYGDFKDDPNYVREAFNEKTGGFVVRHRNSQYSLDKLPQSERAVVDLLTSKGNRIVLPEFYRSDLTKNFDLSIDFSDWDVKEISGNIKRRSEEHIREAMGQAANVILRFTRKPDVDAIKRALGNVKNVKRLNAVMVVHKDSMAVISKAEILRNEYTALEVLK